MRFESFVQNWAATEQLDNRFAAWSSFVLVDAAQHAFLDALWHLGHGVVLVVHREVVVDGFTVLVHPAQAILDDYGHLVRECRIVGDAVGIDTRHDHAMPITVLQPLPRERRAARSAAHEEAFAARVTERPDEITHALKAKH